jgi:hypothetical protein
MNIGAAIPLTCWLCAVLAIPRRPCPRHEVQEFLYRRRVGRQQTCAVAATEVVAFVHLLAAIVSP